jgi:hypothetical protein
MALGGVFDDRIICYGLWPFDFYICGNSKTRVYIMYSHTEEKLRENIRREIWKLLRRNLGKFHSM